jgi:hypothetical protein
MAHYRFKLATSSSDMGATDFALEMVGRERELEEEMQN